MSLTRRRISKGRLILGLFGFLIIAAASFLIARANFANAALAELNPDDWTLELVFFDDDVNNGREPLTNVQWNIEDSTILDTYQRTITMQVNYRNENVDKTYDADSLSIAAPNIMKLIRDSTNDVTAYDYAISSGGEGYDWQAYGSIYNSDTLYFHNKTPIEINSNTEGSIQIKVILTSIQEKELDKYNDSCDKYLDLTNLQATLNSNVISNTAELHFHRHTAHQWQQLDYYVAKVANDINSYDNLGENASDYIWVNYKFGGKSTYDEDNGLVVNYDDKDYTYQMSGSADHPIIKYYGLIGLKDFYIRDKFPTDVKIVDINGNPISQDDEGYVNISRDGTDIGGSRCYQLGIDYQSSCWAIFVGYPKSTYNEESNNMTFTNKAELRGTYSNEEEEKELATDEIEMDLSRFNKYITPGRNFLNKYAWYNFSSNKKPIAQQDMIKGGGQGTFNIQVESPYNGATYGFILGDDYLFYTDDGGENYHKLNESDYYVSSIGGFSPENSYGVNISSKYDPKLYIRRANEESYSEYGTIASTVSFSEDDHVVAWYIEMKNVTEKVKSNYVRPVYTFKSPNYAKEGTIYNLAYLKQVVNGELVNESALDSYPSEAAKELVAPYDLSVYGTYLQRSQGEIDWAYQEIGGVNTGVSATKNHNNINVTYDAANEVFKGSFNIGGSVTQKTKNTLNDMDDVFEQLTEDDMLTRVDYIDLFPLGMEPQVSSTTLKNKVLDSSCPTDIKNPDGTKAFTNKWQCSLFLYNHFHYSLVKNWHNTGRTLLKISFIFEDAPKSLVGTSGYFPSFNIPYTVSYDSYVENGRDYTNRVYVSTNLERDDSGWSYTRDNGTLDAQEVDMDEDGNTEERIAYASDSVLLISATSSKQDLQTSVLTNHNGKYDTDPALSGLSEDYSYKLRVRTGPSRVTNLVLYEHLEEEYGNNEHWQGNFDSIDISYTENQLDYYDNPITIKVYWSENSDAGSLSEDDSWQEYDENTVDKGKVRSLAFQYLDQDGNPAIFAQNFYTYVIVNMKAPDNENVMTLAYNNSHSEWNAIDNLTGELIYNITGIQSNIVVVLLSEKYNLTVKKVWSDFDNYYNIRPSSITFNLLKDGSVVDTKDLNVEDGQTELIFENLNVIDQNLYSVQEISVNEYTSEYQLSDDLQTATFTNTITRDDPGTGGDPDPDPDPDPEPDPDPDPDPDPTGDDVLPKTNDNIRTFFLGGAIAIAVSATGFVVIRRRR